MTVNLILQYVAVGAILIGAVVWVAVKMRRKRKRPSSCGDCTLCSSVKRDKTPPCVPR